MYQTLFTKIGETLTTVKRVKDVFNTPKTKLTKFPCVFYRPDGFTNQYETNSENAKVYRFMLLVLVGPVDKSIETAFGTVLPKVVDDIVAAFDSQWNKGTVDGHRVTCKIDSADAWQVSEEQDGLVAYAPLNLEIKLLTDV